MGKERGPAVATLTDRLDLLLGEQTAKTLRTELELRTVGDLLRHYPRTYLRAGALMAPEEITAGAHVTIAARIVRTELVAVRGNPRKKILKAELDDGRHRLAVTFFSPHKVRHHIRQGRRALVSGKLGSFRGRLQLTHPDYVLLDDAPGTDAADPAGEQLLGEGRTVRGGGRLAEVARALQATGGGLRAGDFSRALLPIYPATAEVQTWVLMRCVRQVLDQLEPVADPLPDHVAARYGHVDLDTALRSIHLPSSDDDATAARRRLRFDEAATMQLLLARRRRDAAGAIAPACVPREGGASQAFVGRLPFRLTDGQKGVLGEIRTDLSAAVPMRRLLQGEVGSGKTVVAVAAMLQVIDGGHQCAMLAPTEVLAVQHARSVRELLGPLGRGGELTAAPEATTVTLLTGSMSTAHRRAALMDIASGRAGIVVGTHALLEDAVEFVDLGLVVVDEQHRFGVEQRDRLAAKSTGATVPHLLAMTATPIPRTIAMTEFGDLDTSTLRQVPRGRCPVATTVVSMPDRPGWVARAWERVREEVAEGHRVYVVCPRIGDTGSEPPARSDAAAASGPSGRSRPPASAGTGVSAAPAPHTAVEVYDKLSNGPLASLRIGLLHGRQPAAEKDEVMREFSGGGLDVLVCTTVIEVGVDVPEATMMVIMDADRFGISQLHQLRGRVGRGADPGLCILVSGRGEGAPSGRRLEAVAATTDGFELARLDLRLRREGDVVGAAQSGRSSGLKLLSVLDDEDVIAEAREFAAAMTAADPDLSRHPGLAEMVATVEGTERADFLERG